MSATFTAAQVATHNTEKDCWVIIEGNVYDVTAFLAKHPGGKAPILKVAGGDGTRQFLMLHERSVLTDHAHLKIGTVVSESEAIVPVASKPTQDWVFGNWIPPVGNDSVPKPVPVTPQSSSWSCGGTAHYLPAERARATFDVAALTDVIDGGAAATKQRRWIWSTAESFDNSVNITLPREDLVAQHITRFIGLHRQFVETYRPSPGDVLMMTNASKNSGALSLHYGAFLPTLLSQGTMEQLSEWLYPTLTMRIIGCLAQTELGHGSNVRALQTTATYDPTTQEFVLNTPTLQSMKWWPGGLGLTSTHAALYAQLIVNGEELGFHVFLLQLRDENHNPLPGVEVGEVGPKIGDDCTETGYLRLENVRIPRTWMLMKNQHVTEDGKYVKNMKAAESKSMYSTMLTIRAGLVGGAGYKLAQGVTIAIRYSCVRHQGFTDTKNAKGRLADELSVLDYNVQRYRLFKQLATAYAFVINGRLMSNKFSAIRDAVSDVLGDESVDGKPKPQPVGPVDEAAVLRSMKEMHATSSGLKAFCTFTAAEGLEDCRKCCGGHGVMLASGIAQLCRDYVTVVTAEGDRIILELQSARFLINTVDAVLSTKSAATLSDVCGYLAPVLNPTAYITSGFTRGRAGTKIDWSDLSTLLDMFQHRAFVSVFNTHADFTATLAEYTKRGAGNAFDLAWNKCAIDLVAMSRAHCWYIMVKNFVSQVDATADVAVKAALKDLCALFALTHVQENIGDFAQALTNIPKQGREIRAMIVSLLESIRPNAVALVDAFEFPDNVLNSALGRYDGNVYESLYRFAKSSPLNAVSTAEKIKAALSPYLDKEFIKEHAACVRVTPPAAKL